MDTFQFTDAPLSSTSARELLFKVSRVYIRAMSIHEKSKLIPPESKLGILKLLIEETQKYELLTTNQYLPQIELVVRILEELSK